MITYVAIGLFLAFSFSVGLIVYHQVWGIEFWDDSDAYLLSVGVFAITFFFWPLALIAIAIAVTAKYIAYKIKRGTAE